MSTGDVVLTIIVVGALAIGLASMLVGRAVAIYDRLTVNRSQQTAPEIMSNSAESDRRLSPSSLQTAHVQTSDQTKIGKTELLTLYGMLRAAGVSRDKARGPLNGVGVPLDNNLWAQAAPPTQSPAADDDAMLTPFAGRITRKSYYPNEPELEYQPPRT